MFSLHAHLEVRALIHAPADVGVFALVILAHNIHVDIAGLIAVHRRGDAGQQAHRAQVDVLLKLAADRDQQTPERDVIRHTREADGTKENRIAPRELPQPVLRHHRAGLGVALAVPIVMLEAVVEAVLLANRLKNAQPFGHNLVADPVAGDD